MHVISILQTLTQNIWKERAEDCNLQTVQDKPMICCITSYGTRATVNVKKELGCQQNRKKK